MKLEIVKVEDGYEAHIVIKLKDWPNFMDEIKQFLKFKADKGQDS